MTKIEKLAVKVIKDWEAACDMYSPNPADPSKNWPYTPAIYWVSLHKLKAEIDKAQK